MTVEIYCALDLFFCRMAFLYASDKLERAKGIKALTSVFAQPFTAFFFRYGFYLFCIILRISAICEYPEYFFCMEGIGKPEALFILNMY